MAVSRRTERPRSTLALLVLASVTLVTLDARDQGTAVLDGVRDGVRDALVPVQSAADRILAPVGDVVGGVASYGDLEAENERLRAQLDEARGRAAAGADAVREREQLLAQAGLASAVPTVAARVVADAASNFDLTVEVDRGRAAGVGTGMPVVTAAGLVGRVVEVSERRATVRLVTDPQSDVGVRLASSGDLALVKGRGAGRSFAVDLVGPQVPVTPGEVLVTSGLQTAAYPPGLVVATVRSAELRTGALQQDVVADPVADLSRLAFVRVLQWAPGGA